MEERSPPSGDGLAELDTSQIRADLDGDTVANVNIPFGTVQQHPLINDEFGGVPWLVVETPTDGILRVLTRRLDNETRSFSVAKDTLLDEDSHCFRYNGTVLEGPNAGEQLERRVTHGLYWFAWASIHPNTSVYGASEYSGTWRDRVGSSGRTTGTTRRQPQRNTNSKW